MLAKNWPLFLLTFNYLSECWLSYPHNFSYRQPTSIPTKAPLQPALIDLNWSLNWPVSPTIGWDLGAFPFDFQHFNWKLIAILSQICHRQPTSIPTKLHARPAPIDHYWSLNQPVSPNIGWDLVAFLLDFLNYLIECWPLHPHRQSTAIPTKLPTWSNQYIIIDLWVDQWVPRLAEIWLPFHLTFSHLIES